MRLEFNILWFENQPQDIKAQIEEVEDHLRAASFIPKIDMQQDTTRVRDLAERQQQFDDYDLVVVDFLLGESEMTGAQVAREVRKGFGFTDIVFYSGYTTADLRKHVYELEIDGVYCIPRTDLVDRLCLRIDQAVRRLSRLEAMRGLAVGIVGKCDDAFRGMLLAEHDAADAQSKAAMVHALDDAVASAAESSRKGYSACATFEDRLGSRAVTSFHLQKLALAVTKRRTSCANERAILKKYNNEVLEVRNTLGHASEIPTDSGWALTSRGGAQITPDTLPNLRQALARHRDNIATLCAILARERGKEPG